MLQFLSGWIDNRDPGVMPGLFRVAFVLHFGIKHTIFISYLEFLFFI